MTAGEIVGGVALAAVAVGGTLTWAALSPQSQIFGRTLVAPARPDEIALTYDDGPNPAATPQLLEALAKRGVRASFFLIGRYVRQCPALVREIAAAGHLVGNHSMTHPWLAWQSAARIREELHGASAAIEDVLGAPVRYFRAPHGARRPVVLKTARAMGMEPVQWNVICGDWSPIGVERIAGRASRGIERSRRRGFAANVVLHDGGQHGLGVSRIDTVRATERLMERYAGMRFVGVDDWGSAEESD